MPLFAQIWEYEHETSIVSISVNNGGTPMLFDVFARNEGTRLAAAQKNVLV